MKQTISRLIFGESTDKLWTWWRVAAVAIMAIAVVAFVVSAACTPTKPPTSATDGNPSVTSPEPTGQPPVSPDKEAAAIAKKYAKAVAIIETSKGTMKMTFFAADAPKTVDSFATLANKRFYDGLKWHRLVPGFVIQGGDPYSKTGKGPVGTGGPGYSLPAEFNSHKHVLGSVAMARAADPNSAGSQFYIALAPLPQLDGEYTVFGRLTSGIDVLKKLRAPADGQLTAATLKKADVIKSIRVVNISK